jgi:hypothetical protein
MTCKMCEAIKSVSVIEYRGKFVESWTCHCPDCGRNIEVK